MIQAMRKRTPIRAIRDKCLDCCGNQYGEVEKCPSKDCALWSYRKGKRPGFPENYGPSGGVLPIGPSNGGMARPGPKKALKGDK